MASVLEILNRASRITGLRYDGADDDGSEAELLRQALEDTYIDVMMEVGPVERTYTHVFGPNAVNDMSVEQYNEYGNFVYETEDIAAAAVSVAVPLPGPMNPSGKVTVENALQSVTYVETADYTLDRAASTITVVAGGQIDIDGLPATIKVTYFKAAPTLLVNDDIRIPPFLKMRSVVYNQTSAGNYPLLYVSENEILEYRRGFQSTGYARMYAMSGNSIMRFWPRPVHGDSITVTYTPLPPKLDEVDNRPAGMWDSAIWDLSKWDDFRGVESTPNLIPIQFHWNTLLAGVVVQAMDKDQRTEDIAFWQARYDAGITKMHLWFATFGNNEASPIFDSASPQFSQWPDQRSRSWGW